VCPEMTYRLSSIMFLVLTVAVLLVTWTSYGAIVLLVLISSSILMMVVRYLSIATRIDRKFFRFNYVVAMLLFGLLLSSGPATGWVVQNDNSRFAVSAYQIVYGPVTDFFAMLPPPIASGSRHYVNLWMPNEVSLDDDWPRQTPLLISWSRPNKKERIWMGIERDVK
jgi:hypothetical protein